jgi:hypothetical protein
MVGEDKAVTRHCLLLVPSCVMLRFRKLRQTFSAIFDFSAAKIPTSNNSRQHKKGAVRQYEKINFSMFFSFFTVKG